MRENQTAIIALSGISRYLLENQVIGNVSNTSKIMISKYLQSFHDPTSVDTELKPFKVDHIIEVLTICAKSNPHFTKANLSFEKKLTSNILIGDRMEIFTKLINVFSLLAEFKGEGALEVLLDYDESDEHFVVGFSGSYLTSKMYRWTNTQTPPDSGEGHLSICFDAVAL